MKQNQKLFFCLIFLFVFVYTKLIIVFNQSVSRICLTYFFYHYDEICLALAQTSIMGTLQTKYYCFLGWSQSQVVLYKHVFLHIIIKRSTKPVFKGSFNKMVQIQWCSTFQLFPKHQCETDTEKLFLSILNSH